MVSQTSEHALERASINHREQPDLSDPNILLTTLQELRQTVEREGVKSFEQWKSHIHRADFLMSAANLAQYLALRRHDLRSLQAALMPWGLSSLGRIEARVMPNLTAVIATLEAICHSQPNINRPPVETFFEGDRLLQKHTEELFGPTLPHRRVRIMVTLPTEAASNYELVREIVHRGANCVRINCAHDTPLAWEKMIDYTRRAEQETGKVCKVMMDLAGPKIRTGPILAALNKNRVFKGDHIFLSRSAAQTERAEGATPGERSPAHYFQTSCTIPDILDLLTIGSLVYIDDGNSFVQRPTDIQRLQQELDQRTGRQLPKPAIVAKIETPVAISNLPELIIYAAGKSPHIPT